MSQSNLYRIRVSDVLHKDVVSISASDSLQTALELMTESHLTALPVVDAKNRCAGILTASDIVEVARSFNEEMHDVGRSDEASYDWLRDNMEDHDMARHTVSEFMTDHVATIKADALLSTAAADMLRHRVHRLPVVDEKERLLGIISTMDVLQAFVDGVPECL